MQHSKLSLLWQFVPALNAALQPVRLNLIIAAIAPVLFLLVPQGYDLLDALGSRRRLDLTILWFFVGLTAFGLMNWFGPRFLLDCEFGHNALGADARARFAGDAAALQFLKDAEHWLRAHLPRVLGTAPIVLIGFGFARLGWTTGKVNPAGVRIHWLLAGLCIALALALYGFFVKRHRWFNLTRPAAAGGTRKRYAKFSDLKADRVAFAGFGAFVASALVLGVAFTVFPVPTGFAIGAGAVLLFALASWACYGALVIYLGHRWGLPTLTLCVVWALLCSLRNDNHEVRWLPGQTETPRTPLVDRLDAWHDQVVARYGPGRQPLIIVVTEGGGIRAAYWTASVLGVIERESQGRFADHVFAISGVSGGSLGAATFDLMLEEKIRRDTAQQVRDHLGQDFLAPLVGKMCFPDFAQRLLPVRFPALDRARALENGWAAATPRFDAPFTAFYAQKSGAWRPELFLNATEVESGRRIITSTVAFENHVGGFVDAIDGVKKMAGQVMRLSTAVHSSARFTYFSPAGRYPDGTHVVDGGYYENSGGSTGHDILRAVRHRPWAKDVIPMVVVLTNGPEAVGKAKTKQDEELAERKNDYTSNEILDPLLTMLATRPAHADQAVGELESAIRAAEPDAAPRVFRFGIVQHGTPPPLGWALSPEAMTEMDLQADPSAAREPPGDDPIAWAKIMENKKTRENLIARLPERKN
ncbi:MAG: hypothetical protein RLZZ15_3776 [Verrucomicrobiota bacterium]|jgi:hypothetical protein